MRAAHHRVAAAGGAGEGLRGAHRAGRAARGARGAGRHGARQGAAPRRTLRARRGRHLGRRAHRHAAPRHLPQLLRQKL